MLSVVLSPDLSWRVKMIGGKQNFLLLSTTDTVELGGSLV